MDRANGKPGYLLYGGTTSPITQKTNNKQKNRKKKKKGQSSKSVRII